jgi:hypothetical protein
MAKKKRTKAKKIAPIKHYNVRNARLKDLSGERFIESMKSALQERLPMLKVLENCLLEHRSRDEFRRKAYDFASLYSAVHGSLMWLDRHNETDDKFPAELQPLLKSYRANQLALQRTKAAIYERLPKSNRERWICRLEEDLDKVYFDETKLLIGIAFVKGVFDYDDVLSKKLEAIEDSLRHVRYGHYRQEVYQRNYLEPLSAEKAA